MMSKQSGLQLFSTRVLTRWAAQKGDDVKTVWTSAVFDPRFDAMGGAEGR